jgi:2'-5' RNA ligase
VTEPESVRRLFFALWPNAEALARAVDAVATLVPRGAGRPQRPDQLHLTLEFLGSVPESRMQAVREAGAMAAASGRPGIIVLDRLEHWWRPQVLCVTASVVPESIVELVRSLRDELAARGFRPEQRQFRAHMTLARKVMHAPSPVAVEPLAWPVNEITLVESSTDPAGSRYSRLESWPLGH